MLNWVVLLPGLQAMSCITNEWTGHMGATAILLMCVCVCLSVCESVCQCVCVSLLVSAHSFVRCIKPVYRNTPTQSQPSAVTFRLNHSPHSSLSSLSSSSSSLSPYSSSSSSFSASNRPRSVNRSRRFSWFSCQWQNTFCFLCILVNIPKGGTTPGLHGVYTGVAALGNKKPKLPSIVSWA